MMGLSGVLPHPPQFFVRNLLAARECVNRILISRSRKLDDKVIDKRHESGVTEKRVDNLMLLLIPGYSNRNKVMPLKFYDDCLEWIFWRSRRKS